MALTPDEISQAQAALASDDSALEGSTLAAASGDYPLLLVGALLKADPAALTPYKTTPEAMSLLAGELAGTAGRWMFPTKTGALLVYDALYAAFDMTFEDDDATAGYVAALSFA